jgi:16S rRNA (cytosine967-C5)-methyltransferase
MRWTNRLNEFAADALGRALRFEYPADAVLSQFFREHPTLGHAERGMIAEVVFAVLRRKRSLEAVCEDKPRPGRLLLASLVNLQCFNLRQIDTIVEPGEVEWLGSSKGHFLKDVSPAVRADLPDWLYERFVAQWGENETQTIAASLNRPAPLDVRVNVLKGKRDEVLPQLVAAGLLGKATPLSPQGIRLEGKPALSKYQFFKDGIIEVQDEGSQLLGLLLAPKRGEMVADFCAGAGGKTLLLGALMRSQGRLYAFDVSEKRLANLKPRLARSGLSNVHPVRIDSERDAKIKRLAGKLDRVLVDAPCSGLGTLRRNPDLKWRQTPEAVSRLAETQASILAAAASLLKAGGRLVYATCSLLRQENDDVVDAFLAAHPDFVQLDAQEELARQGVALELPGEAPKRLRLLPHLHGTDGFFAVALERRP